MKLAICDDEKRIRDLIAESVRDVSESMKIEFYADARGILAPDFDADILFLDIQMPGIDGMKAARMMREDGRKTVIVFVTALEEQVFNAFDVGALNYIVKPFKKDRIRAVIKKAIEQAEENGYIERTLSEKEEGNESARSITVKSGGSNTRVILGEIAYAEIYDRRIILHMNDRDNIEYYGRISDLESIAGKDFYRVHRAFLINLAYVKSYDSKSVRVTDTDIPVARGKYQELVKAYLSYYTRSEDL
ncbi:MAG: LytTR family DNA-binding domain-containing protein [Lachnospiraceae bacterium]|nr:LytTR family DNA-binding domain-containing protein [Lachnospiraceae bacterium]